MGFLTSARGSELETVIPRVFAGEFRVVQLATLEARLQGDEVEKGVNDVVVTSARVGRMAELRWEIEGEHLGDQQCDGMICATPAGSTAYNLSNGGPVMMWGIDAMGITFVAPHSLEARPWSFPRGYELKIENLTRGGDVAVIVDGRAHDSSPATRSWSASARSGAARAPPRGQLLHALPRRLQVVLRSLRIENFVLIREAGSGSARG